VIRLARILFIGTAALAAVVLITTGCEKEKIVETTEYIQETEYIELPPDTVRLVDTILSHDSVFVHQVDTVIQYDTVTQTTVDTVIQVTTVHDTIIVIDTIVQVDYVYDTLFVHDTIVTVEHHYDTVTVTDTVQIVRCDPNEHFAFAALQYHTNPLVLDLVLQEFGLVGGWIFYLTEYQVDLVNPSAGVYDIYGYVNYWMTDWSGYYPLEYYWRLVYSGGDPADPANWQMTEPPSGASSAHRSGLRLLDAGEAGKVQR
jgi:hypothetical protein